MKNTKGLNIFFIIFVSLIVSAGSYRPAAAHVLQGLHILDLMVHKIGKANRLLVEQILTLHESLPNQAPVEIAETIRYIFPESFRSDILSPTTQRIHVLSKGITLTILDGRASFEEETGFERYKDLLLYQSRKLLEQQLIMTGIDVDVSSFGRFQDKIAYVVGAQYPDEAPSQLWVQKDTFLPLRWILKTSADDGFLEFRYHRWQKIDNIQYPMNIECYQNGRLVREINVKSYSLNPTFPKELFDIQQLQAHYKIETLAEPVSEDLSEVQKTIEEFKKSYE